MIFRVVRNLAVLTLLGTSFHDRLVKEILPPEQKIVHHDFVKVRVIITVISTEDKRNQKKPEEEMIESVTVPEEARNLPHRLYAWQRKQRYRPS